MKTNVIKFGSFFSCDRYFSDNKQESRVQKNKFRTCKTVTQAVRVKTNQTVENKKVVYMYIQSL